jgi:hypothetical protein
VIVEVGGIRLDLTDEQVADLRRQLGVEAPVSQWIDATEAARRLGVSRDYIYAHADALGAKRLGDGPKARLRFNVAKLAAPGERAGSEAKPNAPKRRQRKVGVPLLEVRGTRPGEDGD